MKIKNATKEAPEKPFEPVSIEITFETRAEMMDFYNIFNYSPITYAVCLDTEAIRDHLNVYNSDSFDKFSSLVEEQL